MNENQNLKKLTFLKNQMINENPNNLEYVEPTICQIFKDIFGIANEYTRKADLIYKRFDAREDEPRERFERYMKLIKQAEAYLSLDVDSIGLINKTYELSTGNPTVFLSYCWADTEIANQIDNYLKSKEIVISRDVRDVDHWQSLKEFMQTIREKDYAILLVSDSYLKSVNCMYEVLEVMKERQYSKKIMPVVTNKDIYSFDEQCKYVAYWQDEAKKLHESIKTLDYTNGLPLGIKLKQTEDIARNIAEFLKIITDMKNPDMDNISESIYNFIMRN